jgi:hypothetical protein
VTQQKKRHIGRTSALGLIMAVASIIVILSVPEASAGQGQAQPHCVKPQKLHMADVKSTTGEIWTLSIGVQSQAGCRSWLLNTEFAPESGRAGTWRWGNAIPPNGQVGDNFTLEAAESSESGVFGGISSAATHLLVLKTSSGSSIRLHPKLPLSRLRRKHVWLNNLRFFLRPIPADLHVSSVTGYDSSGRVLYHVASDGEGFEGVGAR